MDNRYSRQLLDKNIGRDGQRLLGEKTAVILGLGALGSLSSEMLARAGIGKLILVDRDYVEVTNLQRQTLCTEQDAAAQKPKAAAAHEQLSTIYSSIDIESYIAHSHAVLVESIAEDAHMMIDGSDNFDTQMLLDDASFKFRIPWIYAACVEASAS